MLILIDNYDSFSYNLYQMLGEMEPDIQVYRSDALTVEQLLGKKPSRIILSPGPGHPSRAGICEDLIRTLAVQERRIPLLGVCLGHQAICEAFGGRIVPARRLMHGKAEPDYSGTGFPFVPWNGSPVSGGEVSLSGSGAGYPAGLSAGDCAD